MHKLDKRNYFIILIISIFCSPIKAQKDLKWDLGIISGYQIGLNKKNGPYYTIVGNNEPAVHQLGVFLNRQIVNIGKFKIDGGIAISLERVAGKIVVGDCFGSINCFENNTIKNGYTVSLLETPIYFKYSVLPKFNLNFGIVPQFRFYQNHIVHESSSKLNFGFNGVESYLGLGYNLHKLNFNLGYRWLNYRTIDTVFYHRYDLIDPLISVGYSRFYNPVKLRLLISFNTF